MALPNIGRLQASPEVHFARVAAYQFLLPSRHYPQFNQAFLWAPSVSSLCLRLTRPAAVSSYF
ncbi:unnamed protein product, partial [Gulo gulo]